MIYLAPEKYLTLFQCRGRDFLLDMWVEGLVDGGGTCTALSTILKVKFAASHSFGGDRLLRENELVFSERVIQCQ